MVRYYAAVVMFCVGISNYTFASDTDTDTGAGTGTDFFIDEKGFCDGSACQKIVNLVREGQRTSDIWHPHGLVKTNTKANPLAKGKSKCFVAYLWGEYQRFTGESTYSGSMVSSHRAAKALLNGVLASIFRGLVDTMSLYGLEVGFSTETIGARDNLFGYPLYLKLRAMFILLSKKKMVKEPRKWVPHLREVFDALRAACENWGVTFQDELNEIQQIVARGFVVRCDGLTEAKQRRQWGAHARACDALFEEYDLPAVLAVSERDPSAGASGAGAGAGAGAGEYAGAGEGAGDLSGALERMSVTPASSPVASADGDASAGGAAAKAPQREEEMVLTLAAGSPAASRDSAAAAATDVDLSVASTDTPLSRDEAARQLALFAAGLRTGEG